MQITLWKQDTNLNQLFLGLYPFIRLQGTPKQSNKVSDIHPQLFILTAN